MLSEDFALSGYQKRQWKDWYEEEIVNNEMFKTLFFSYKGRFFQFEPIGYALGKSINGREIKDDSYIFVEKKSDGHSYRDVSTPMCFDTFKEAVDTVQIEPGKTLKDIWDDPESEYIDFL
jgi:hypothetical protein